MSDLGFGLMMLGLGFLLGFKIAARMGDKQLERMKRIHYSRGVIDMAEADEMQRRSGG